MDCLARSRALHPRSWVSLTDGDEFYLPSPFNDTASSFIMDFTRSRSSRTASVCIGRTRFRPPAVLGSSGLPLTPAPAMLYLGSQWSRAKRENEWNLKCLHRVEAVEHVFVHWPETFRNDQQAEEVEWYDEITGGVPIIAHLQRGSHAWPAYRMPYDATTELTQYLGDLWRRRDEVAVAL